MRQAAKVDGNQPEIVAALEQYGCSVLSLAAVGFGAPDLLVGYRERNYLMEIKDPSTSRGRRGLNAAQRAFAQSWRGRKVAVVYTVDDAVAVLVA